MSDNGRTTDIPSKTDALLTRLKRPKSQARSGCSRGIASIRAGRTTKHTANTQPGRRVMKWLHLKSPLTSKPSLAKRANDRELDAICIRTYRGNTRTNPRDKRACKHVKSCQHHGRTPAHAAQKAPWKQEEWIFRVAPALIYSSTADSLISFLQDVCPSLGVVSAYPPWTSESFYILVP